MTPTSTPTSTATRGGTAAADEPALALAAAQTLLVRQLRGIERWHEAQRGEGAREASGMSREARLDASRRAHVVARQRQALTERAALALRLSGLPMWLPRAVRAVVAHRHAWVRARLAEELEAQGVEVLAVVDNGADAVGICAAEQPTLLVVDDSLGMASGAEVATEVRLLCPDTVVAAYPDTDRNRAALLRAGVTSVQTRRVPPRDVATTLVGLVRP